MSLSNNCENGLPRFNNPPPPPPDPIGHWPERIFSEKELAAIEEMAGHGFTINEIADVIGTDTKDRKSVHRELYCVQNSPGYLAYRKGLLESELALRQRIFQDAKNGSSPAQTLAKKILDEAVYKLNQ